MSKKSPSPVDRHVGSRVRMRRMLIGMSQEKLGEMLGLTFQQVQKYEKGTNRIGASRLQQIAGILGVPVALLVRGRAEARELGDEGPWLRRAAFVGIRRRLPLDSGRACS